MYPGLTAAENLRFFGRLYGVRGKRLESRVAELLEFVGLAGRGDQLVSEFSGGMKRRLNVAVALVHGPRLILLDEPTVGVDPQSREHIFGLVHRVRDAGRHPVHHPLMEAAEALCDRLGIMDHGKLIAAGTLVETKIVTPRDEFAVIYDLRAAGDRWLATEVRVEDVSLTTNLGSQLDRLLSRASIEDVLDQLRRKYGDGRSAGSR